MFEKRTNKLATRNAYYKRLLKSFLVVSIFMSVSLTIGVVGYHFIANMSWTDSLLNASMILGGMGPVDQITNQSGKIFASFYALYSGISFLTSFSILIAPAFHRLMHKFHLDNDDDQG